jgi:tRNA threonylcarbamoyladenosine biosynthesis protein TsaB
MPCLLTIETATTVCSMALSVDKEVIFSRIETKNASHAAVLGVFASEAVDTVREKGLRIDAVAVSAGPGSYTGLRIGVSEAKGLCYGFDIPLIAIPTLTIMASQILQQCPGCYACPMIDARRMEVYAAIYDAHLHEIRPVQADIVDENTYLPWLETHRMAFAGNGSDKCRALLQSPNAVVLDHLYPTAEAMIPWAEEAFARSEFVDTAYFEPFYLKDFQATKARNKVLGGN